MNNERTLAWHLAHKMTQAELAEISAAGMTHSVTYQSTLSVKSMDNQFDYIPDVA